MPHTTCKRTVACALFGFLLCYAILSRSFPQTRSKTHWGLVSKIMAWGFDRPETLVSRALTPVIENTTWHGTTLLSNFSSHLWFTQYGDLKLLSEALVSGGLNISALAEYSVASLPLEAEEAQLLHDPPLSDPLAAANETMSRVTILGPPDNYSVGDTLQLKVDVFNGRGSSLSRGGDQIRVWGVDPTQQASVATEVSDLGNGSYLASLPLLWPGEIQIKVGLTYNRETLRAISFVKVAVRTTKFIAAGFFSDFGNAATLCATCPFVPGGYEELCDLSESNGGLPWYCGKPRNPALSCNHWTHIADIQFVQPLPLTTAEKTWMQWLDVPRNLRVVRNFQFQYETNGVHQGVPSVKVRPSAPDSDSQPKPFCNQRDFNDTWVDTPPRGFWLKQVWTPHACTMPALVPSRVTSCLTDTTVLLLGDSNLRLALVILKELIDCKLDTGEEVKPKWHRPMRCVNAQAKTEIRWRTHAHPFHTGNQDWADRRDQMAVNEYIDEVPEQGKFIIIVHLYLHFTTELLQVFRAHIRAVRRSVERLLVRNPQAKIVIRAPHAASQFWPSVYSTDSFAWALTKIIQTEFLGLYDSVLFIQPWDMTVAAENVDSHPPDYINKAILNLILSHYC